MSTATHTLDALESAVPLREAKIPGDPCIATRTRWVLCGIKDPRGNRVKLRAWKVGGKLMTTRIAIDQFLSALNCEHIDDDETPADVTRRGREAGAALEALGF